MKSYVLMIQMKACNASEKSTCLQTNSGLFKKNVSYI